MFGPIISVLCCTITENYCWWINKVTPRLQGTNITGKGKEELRESVGVYLNITTTTNIPPSTTKINILIWIGCQIETGRIFQAVTLSLSDYLTNARVGWQTERTERTFSAQRLCPCGPVAVSLRRPVSMGVPAWAEAHVSTTGRQTGGTETRSRCRSGTRGFPVHRLECSPVIASYTQERGRISGASSQSVRPGEVVWKIKGEDSSSKHSQVNHL